jgi:1-deoxy-D-xylulose-5-phosphate reductoisomerase
MKKISILGSTGSIGVQSLQVVDAFPDQFSIWGLSAGQNIERFKSQILTYRPEYVCVRQESDYSDIKSFVREHSLNCEVGCGASGLTDIASSKEHSLILLAIVGTAALMPAYTAIQSGTDIGLASKEVLVSAGAFLMELATHNNVTILPMDSEHAALHQCIAGVSLDQVQRLVLTASGGPFLHTPFSDFPEITVKQALKHPKWNMGPKISIDSATMMNKGLEVIEAYHLFGVDLDRIDVVVHPQSIVHSLVEFKDGTFLAQMGNPDMRFPIQYVMTHPEKWENSWPKLDLTQMGNLSFMPPDDIKFPLLGFAYECARLAGTWPAVMNAANEAAVGLFLEGKLSFSEISSCVIGFTRSFSHQKTPSLLDIINLDCEVKSWVRKSAN